MMMGTARAVNGIGIPARASPTVHEKKPGS